MKDGHDSHYRAKTFCTKLHSLQTVQTEKWEHTLKEQSTQICKTETDTYPHSERELLCSSGQVVILCFKSFTLTVKNLPLYTPFCTERNTQKQNIKEKVRSTLIPLSHKSGSPTKALVFPFIGCIKTSDDFSYIYGSNINTRRVTSYNNQ